MKKIFKITLICATVFGIVFVIKWGVSKISWPTTVGITIMVVVSLLSLLIFVGVVLGLIANHLRLKHKREGSEEEPKDSKAAPERKEKKNGINWHGIGGVLKKPLTWMAVGGFYLAMAAGVAWIFGIPGCMAPPKKVVVIRVPTQIPYRAEIFKAPGDPGLNPAIRKTYGEGSIFMLTPRELNFELSFVGSTNIFVGRSKDGSTYEGWYSFTKEVLGSNWIHAPPSLKSEWRLTRHGNRFSGLIQSMTANGSWAEFELRPKN